MELKSIKTKFFMMTLPPPPPNTHTRTPSYRVKPWHFSWERLVLTKQKQPTWLADVHVSLSQMLACPRDISMFKYFHNLFQTFKLIFTRKTVLQNKNKKRRDKQCMKNNVTWYGAPHNWIRTNVCDIIRWEVMIKCVRSISNNDRGRKHLHWD